MSDSAAEEFPACDVCGRTVLRGERVVRYLTPDREPHDVCALCRDEAEEAGWVKAGSAGSAALPPPARRRGALAGLRRRWRAAGETGERPARAAPRPPREPRPEPPAARAPEPEPSPAPPEPRPAPAAAPTPVADPPVAETPELRMRRAVESFNDSDMRRVVAGLMRSLGPPLAAIRDEREGVEVTVAWELSWYRWRLSPNGGAEPREVGKGDGVAELEDEGIDWNASVDAQGGLRWREGS